MELDPFRQKIILFAAEDIKNKEKNSIAFIAMQEIAKRTSQYNASNYQIISARLCG